MTGVWVVTILTTFWAVFASVVAILPGFLDGQFLNDADLPTDVSRMKYELISLDRNRSDVRGRHGVLLGRYADPAGHGRCAPRGQRRHGGWPRSGSGRLID